MDAVVGFRRPAHYSSLGSAIVGLEVNRPNIPVTNRAFVYFTNFTFTLVYYRRTRYSLEINPILVE